MAHQHHNREECDVRVVLRSHVTSTLVPAHFCNTRLASRAPIRLARPHTLHSNMVPPVNIDGRQCVRIRTLGDNLIADDASLQPKKGFLILWDTQTLRTSNRVLVGRSVFLVG